MIRNSDENDLNSTNMYNILNLSSDTNASNFAFSSTKSKRDTADPIELEELLKTLNDSGSSNGTKNSYFGFDTVEIKPTEKSQLNDETTPHKSPKSPRLKTKSSSKKSRNSSAMKKADHNAFVKIFTPNEDLIDNKKMDLSLDISKNEFLTNISTSSNLTEEKGCNVSTNSNETAVGFSELVFDDSFGNTNSRRDTIDSVDLAGLLDMVENCNTSETSQEFSKASYGYNPRDSLDTVAIMESVEDILNEEENLVSKDYSNVSALSSPGPLENSNITNESKNEISVNDETATLNGSAFLEALENDCSNTSMTTVNTVDVIASIDALLAPHKDDLQLSGGKYPTRKYFFTIQYRL